MTPHWIHTYYHDDNGVLIYLTYVYGHTKVERRYVVWNYLMNLAPTINRPWMIMGYFNQIKSANDKLSTNRSLRGALEF